MTPEGKATTTKTTFSRETSVTISIRSSASVVWRLLTTAADYPRWNTTVVAIEGVIAQGQSIRLRSTLDASREFKLTVKEFDPESRMVWGDSKGMRVYAITDEGGALRFSMTERIGGLMFPLYSKYIPPFDESFEHFARDLKKEAEAQHSKDA